MSSGMPPSANPFDAPDAATNPFEGAAPVDAAFAAAGGAVASPVAAAPAGGDSGAGGSAWSAKTAALLDGGAQDGERDTYGFEQESDVKAAQDAYLAAGGGAAAEKQKEKFAKAFSPHKITVGEGKTVGKQDRKLKKLLRGGIPKEQRGAVWMNLAQAVATTPRDDAYMEQLWAKAGEGSVVTKDTKQLDLDIDRTFPGHPLFDSGLGGDEGMAKLRKVLVCYSVHYPYIGYVQGMGFIVGFLLLFMEEQDAFWMLTWLIEDILPPQYFAPSMVGLNTDLEVLADCVAWKIPKLGALMESTGVVPQLYATKWLLCIYCDAFPTEVTLRVWDSLFAEGTKVLFRVGVALFRIHKVELLACDNMMDMLQILKEGARMQIDPDELLRVAFDDMRYGKFSSKKVEEFRSAHRPELEKQWADQEARRAARDAARAEEQ